MNYLFLCMCIMPYVFLTGMFCADKEKPLSTWQYIVVMTILTVPAFIAGWYIHVIYTM